MITNDTIIKAAKAAGLTVRQAPDMLLWITSEGRCMSPFRPLQNDTDNAMIRRGAEISVEWLPTSRHVEATAFLPDFEFFPFKKIEYKDNKTQAEREAVILCAAAKFDAMNEGVK